MDTITEIQILVLSDAENVLSINLLDNNLWKSSLQIREIR